MRLIIMLLLIGTSCFGHSGVSWADFDVLDVVLANSVRGRQPVNPVAPSAHCEKDKNGTASLPVINSSRWRKVFLWAKIASSSKGSIRHTWHQHIDDKWETVSVVDLPIRPSPGYRMWSAKAFRKINPVGDWMIVLAPSHEPQRVLCITRFRVK